MSRLITILFLSALTSLPVQAAGDPESGQDSWTGHWAFQPVAKPPLPEVQRADWVRQPLDTFILARLEAQQLEPSPRADRRTLIRRATYDLTGLPPKPEDVEAFIRDEDPQAFAKLVDRLLDSPQYGQRWARYWLDIARYADTKGYLPGGVQRRYRYSYTYRDYVIRAFNNNLPYDQFIREQLAADKMDLGENKQALAALGFLTLGRRFLNNQHDIIDDRIDVVTRGTMGITVSCARCHDHKYDPIPIEDYYSLYGVFSNSHEPGEKPLLGILPSEELHKAYLAEKAKRQKKLDDFRAQKVREGRQKVRNLSGTYLFTAQESLGISDGGKRDSLARSRKLVQGVVNRWMEGLKHWRQDKHPLFAPWFACAEVPAEEQKDRLPKLTRQWIKDTSEAPPVVRLLAERLKAQPPDSLEALSGIYGKLFQEADEQWKKQLKDSPDKPAPLSDPAWEAVRMVLYAKGAPANILDDQTGMLLGDAGPRLRELQAKIDEVDATHDGAPPRAMALLDKGNIRQPQVLQRGNPGMRGERVPIQFLGFLSGTNRAPFKDGSGRLEMAQAITHRDNPLTARVWVNRVWMYHFGKPLVRTPSDFGLRAEPPTHPQLLDHLAWRFMENGWRLKNLHRWILLSSAYQQQSAPRDEALEVDSENDLVWRMNRKRQDFEAMRDTFLQVAGHLDLSEGGRSVDLNARPFTTRRTIYGYIDRQNLPNLFRTFDFASPDATSPRRFSTTVPQQALFLMNSPFMIEQAKAWLARPDVAELKMEARLQRMYQLAFQRNPEPEERQWALEFIQSESDPEGEGLTPWEEYAQVLLLSNELMFVD